MPPKTKTPTQRPDAISRAKWTAAKRKAYLKAHPENFAGDNGDYPVEDANDVEDAWNLAGHADNPDAVRAKVIEIAKRLGLSASLPETATTAATRTDTAEITRGGDTIGVIDAVVENDDEDAGEDGDAMEILDDNLADDEDEDDSDDTDIPELQADDPPEDDDQFDDLPPSTNPSPTKLPPTTAVTSTPRVAATPTVERTMPGADVLYYAPITRIVKKKREIIGTATAEVKDSYGTVIGYEASEDALNRWRGNIREMHDPKKAIGRALEVTPDPNRRRIIVRARISKGAEDTWQKVLDGTLSGFSIGGRNGKWTERVIDGEKLPYLERYDAVELSLVDNPACPGCNVEVVRADGFTTEILAKDEEMPPIPKEPEKAPETVERAGARISQETQDAMHMARDHAKSALAQVCSTCGCDDCSAHTDALNSINRSDDNDGDMDANFLAPASMRRLVADIVRREVTAALREQIAPTMQRVNALLASDASRDDDTPEPEITRRVDDITAQLAAIKALIEKIAAQPADGGPVLHGGGAPVDKSIATQPAPRRAIDSEAIQRAMELGFRPPDAPDAQLKAAAALVRPIVRQ